MKEVKFGYFIGLNSTSEIIRQGLLAEKYGFKSIWLPDHLVTLGHLGGTTICPEIWTTITALGMKTNRAILTPGVTDVFRRHPATTAQTVATLDRLLNGRIALGIGAGEVMNLTPFGVDWDRPVSRMREAIECIKLLWSATPEEPANYNGRFFRLIDAFLTIRPVQKPHPRIYIGAMGPRTRQMVGELADGWYPAISPLEFFKKALKDIERGCKKAARNMNEIDLVARFYTAVSDDYVKMKARAEWLAKRSVVLNAHVFKQLGYEISVPSYVTLHQVVPGKEIESAMKEAIKNIPMDAVESISVFGAIEECINKIEKYIKEGASHIVILNAGSDETLKNYGKKIIPYFKEGN